MDAARDERTEALAERYRRTRDSVDPTRRLIAAVFYGEAVLESGDAPGAEAVFCEAVGGLEGSQWTDAPLAWLGLGRSLAAQDRMREAITPLERAFEAFSNLHGARSVNSALAGLELGRAFNALADPAAAVAPLEHALRIHDALNAGDPSSYVSVVTQELGRAYLKLGREAEGLDQLWRALGIHEQLLGAGHSMTQAVGTDIVATLRRSGGLGPYRERLAAYPNDAADDASSPNVSPPDLEAAQVELQRGRDLQAAGRSAEAAACLEKALKAFDAAFGHQPVSFVSVASDTLAQAYIDLGRSDEAESLLARAIALHERLLGPEHSVTLAAANRLATLRAATSHPTAEMMISAAEIGVGQSALEEGRRLLPNDPQAAIQRLERAQRAFAKLRFAAPNSFISVTAGELGRARSRCGDLDGAAVALQEAVSVNLALHGPESPITLRDVEDLAHALAASGARTQALAMLDDHEAKMAARPVTGVSGALDQIRSEIAGVGVGGGPLRRLRRLAGAALRRVRARQRRLRT